MNTIARQLWITVYANTIISASYVNVRQEAINRANAAVEDYNKIFNKVTTTAKENNIDHHPV